MGFGNEDFQREETDMHRLKRRTTSSTAANLEGLRRQLFHGVSFYDIPHFDVIEILQPNSALKPRTDLRGIILEPLQRSNLAFVNHDIVPKKANLGVPPHLSVGHGATSHQSHFGNFEGVTH